MIYNLNLQKVKYVKSKYTYENTWYIRDVLYYKKIIFVV